MKWLARLVLLGFALLVAGGFSELALRIAAPQQASWLAVYRRHPAGLPFPSLLPNLEYAVDTGETKWTLHTDAEGRRVSGLERESQLGAPELLGVGDSFMAGYSVEYAESFAGRIAEAVAPKWHLTNTGVGGYGPNQYAAVIEHRLRSAAKPALVLLSLFAGNDFHDAQWSKDAPVTNGLVGATGDFRSLVKRNSHLYRLVSKVVHIAQAGQGVANPAPFPELHREQAWSEPFLKGGYEKVRDQVARIRAMCREHGVALVVLLIPTAESIAALDESGAKVAGDDPSLPVEKLVAILRELELEFVDPSEALAALGRARAYFPIDRHFTVEGNAVVAQLLLPAIEARMR